jgi:hypothetical protein
VLALCHVQAAELELVDSDFFVPDESFLSLFFSVELDELDESLLEELEESELEDSEPELDDSDDAEEDDDLDPDDARLSVL